MPVLERAFVERHLGVQWPTFSRRGEGSTVCGSHLFCLLFQVSPVNRLCDPLLGPGFASLSRGDPRVLEGSPVLRRNRLITGGISGGEHVADQVSSLAEAQAGRYSAGPMPVSWSSASVHSHLSAKGQMRLGAGQIAIRLRFPRC